MVNSTGRIPVLVQSSEKYLGFLNNQPAHEASLENPIITFGDHTCRMRLMIEPFSLGPNVVPFVPRNDLPAYFLYYNLKDLVHTQEYKRHWKELNNKEVMVPPLELCNNFSTIVSPISRQEISLEKINLNLNNLRNLVLPKLISGEIDVSEIALGD